MPTHRPDEPGNTPPDTRSSVQPERHLPEGDTGANPEKYPDGPHNSGPRKGGAGKSGARTGLIVGLIAGGAIAFGGAVSVVAVINARASSRPVPRDDLPTLATVPPQTDPAGWGGRQPGAAEAVVPVSLPAAPAVDPGDVFARAAAFRPVGALPQLPPLPPAEERPLITLDAGAHTGSVREAFFTPDAARVITLGEDKAIRYWNVATGECERIVHLPADLGLGGVIRRGALSPDGKWLAVGTYPINQVSICVVFIMAAETGTIEWTISGISDIPAAMEFSPDGKRLAVGYASGRISVIDLKTRKPVFSARAHTKLVRELRFHPTLNRLATCSNDDDLKIWDLTARDRPLATDSLPQAHPHGLSWTSDGKTLAVGCWNGEVHLYDADGTPRRVLPWSGELKGRAQVTRIHFLPGDKELLYCGESLEGRAGIIDAETGRRRIRFTGNDNTVVAAAATRDGALAVSAGGERFETIVWRTADGSVVRNFGGGVGHTVWAVGWGADGKSLAWGTKNRHGADHLAPIEHTFRLDEFGIGGPARAADFRRTEIEDERFSIRCPDRFHIVVSEQGRELYTYDTRPGGNGQIGSYTLLPGKGVLVGASGTLFLLDTRTGRLIRRYRGITGNLNALALSPDGRYFVGGASNQTMHVWSPDREEPVLSFFIGGREWIAWTPEGYYACSANGERMIGWQVNNGRAGTPVIHPAVRFRASLYQPVLIKYLIPAGNLRRALALAAVFDRRQIAATTLGAVLPPQVAITSPAADLTTEGGAVTVRAAAAPFGNHPVKSMRLLVDGRPFRGEAGVRRFADGAKAEAEWQVPLGPGIHSFAALAQSPVSQGLSRPVLVTRAGAVPQPSLYALTVGVSDYAGSMKLRYAASDAELLRDGFTKHSKNVFQSVEVKVLTDRAATRQGILAGLDWLASKMTPKDVGVFAFSGHGTRDPAGRFHLVPVDVSLSDPAGTCLSGEEFKRRLANMPGRLVAILDACHSGAEAEAKQPGMNARPDDLVRDLVTDDYGVVVMCSSLGREYSMESPSTRAGFYTLGLVEGLAGKADENRDGVVFLQEWEAFAAERVIELSGGLQHRVTGRPATVRPFAVSRP